MAKVRAKFMCGGFAESYYSSGARVYGFYAVTDDGTEENARYYKASPNGQLSITVDNPDVSFVPGRAYYLDFTEVDAPAADAPAVEETTADEPAAVPSE